MIKYVATYINGTSQYTPSQRRADGEPGFEDVPILVETRDEAVEIAKKNYQNDPNIKYKKLPDALLLIGNRGCEHSLVIKNNP